MTEINEEITTTEENHHKKIVMEETMAHTEIIKDKEIHQEEVKVEVEVEAKIEADIKEDTENKDLDQETTHHVMITVVENLEDSMIVIDIADLLGLVQDLVHMIIADIVAREVIF